MIETILDLSNTKEARRDRRNPYEMHRTLERAFAGTLGRMLWRLDNSILTLRGVGTDLTAEAFPADYIEDGPIQRTVDLFDTIDHSVHGFRLLANATKQESASRRIYNVVGSRNLTAWLVRQGEKHGFQLLDCVVMRSRNHMPKNPKGISIIATEFRGVLKVTDEERFRQCLTNGIGRGKAFGLGLLKLG